MQHVFSLLYKKFIHVHVVTHVHVHVFTNYKSLCSLTLSIGLPKVCIKTYHHYQMNALLMKMMTKTNGVNRDI